MTMRGKKKERKVKERMREKQRRRERKKERKGGRKKVGKKVAVVADTCIPSTGRLRRKKCLDFEVNTDYRATVRFLFQINR